MNKPKIYGGKGGGGSSFVTKPDTLRSDDSFEILLGLGSGRWSGLVDGLQSVTINGVPLENPDGTSNFEGVFAVFADGDPLQDQIVDFTLGGGGNSQSVNTQLANDNPNGPGGWVSGAVNTPGADYIDLRFLVNQLFFQDDKSIRENTATIEIEMRPTGQSEWIDIFSAPISNNTTYNQGGYSFDDGEGNFSRTLYLSRNYFNTSGQGFVASNSAGLTIRGKSTTPTVKELRVSVPNTGRYANVAWQVRARLLEIDTVSSTEDNPVSQSRNITFETITAVISEPLGDDPEWDGLVWLQVYGAASDQFNGFPEIVAYCDTKVCQVPTANVFNPVTREYSSETWDGSFVEAFTTDPAWQIKEFVEDPIHGIAGLYPSARLDKWDALEASKYYSEQVPDGQGGTHPRFSMNLTITESREISDMMQYLAGAVNSYTEEIGEGLWRLKVDKPETPVMLFTEDNVFTEFQYSHSDIDTRFNDWRGTFLDASLDYEVNTVRVFDQDDIDLNGVKFNEVALVGCTNAQEALRRLMFRLRVSLNEFRSISFETNRLGRLINPLDTILVADGGLNPNHLMKSTSRFASTNGNTITLLRELRLESGVSYKINLTTTDGEIIERSITNSGSQLGDVLELSIDSPLPDNIVPESAVALVADNLAALPVQYRVLSVERVEESEDNYRITAIQIDTGKWVAMDNVSAQDIIAQETEIRIDSPTVPILGMFNVTEYSTDAQKKRVLQVNWQRPSGAFLGGYRLEYRLNDGQWITGNENLSDSFYELQNPQDGTYDFRIFALDRRGVQSTPLIGRYTLDSDNEITPPAHLRGPENTRPPSGAYDGFRFTTTDGDVPVTTVWNSASQEWQPESNLVLKGSDIGVADGATNNIGDLADLNAVTLGGPFVVGTLPVTKAVPELINENVPSVQNLRPFGDVTITGSSFKRNSGPSNDSAGVQHFERMSGGWKVSAQVTIFNLRFRLFGYPDFVPKDNTTGLTLPTHQIFYTGAGTIRVAGGHFSEANHSGIKVGDVISLEYTGTQYIARLNGEIIANPRKGLGITPAENQRLIPTVTCSQNGAEVSGILIESTGNNSFSALEGEGSPVPFASSNTFLTANHPDVILDTNRWTLSLQGINKGIATTQSNDGTFFEFRPSSARGTAYASLSDVVANSRNDLGRLYLRINNSGNNFISANVWADGVLKPFHGPIIKTTDRVGLGYDGANYFVTVNRAKVFQYPAPSSLSLTGYLFTSHPADVNTWIFEDITWDTYNNASFESLGGAGLSRGQIETAGGISLGFFGQDYGATASEDEVANTRILIEPDGRLTGGGGGRVTLGGIGAGAVATLDVIDEDHAVNELKNAELVPSIQAAASTAVYSNVLNAPTSLSDLDTAAGTKLGGIANNATRNTGALANRDTVNLAGSFVEGVLPTTKAADGLKNSVLVPSIQSAATTAQYGSVTGAPQALADLDEDADSKLAGIQELADRTDDAIRTIIPQFPMIEIRQFEEGNQGSRLITHFIRRGGTTISGGTWSLGNKLLGAGSASINSSNGLVTLSDINQSGSYEVIYTHTDTIQTRLIINVTYVAAPVSSGGGGGGGSNPPETVLSISNTPSVVDWFQGTTNTVSVSHTAREDGAALSGGTWSIQSSFGGSVTINSNGVATVTNVNSSGFYTVRYTLSGGTRVVNKSINIQFYPNGPGSPNQFE